MANKKMDTAEEISFHNNISRALINLAELQQEMFALASLVFYQCDEPPFSAADSADNVRKMQKLKASAMNEHNNVCAFDQEHQTNESERMMRAADPMFRNICNMLKDTERKLMQAIRLDLGISGESDE